MAALGDILLHGAVVVLQEVQHFGLSSGQTERFDARHDKFLQHGMVSHEQVMSGKFHCVLLCSNSNS